MGRKSLAFDAVCLLAYLAVANPSITGIDIHEWLGLGVFVVLFVHAAIHADWVVETARNALTHPSWTRTGNLVLDSLLLIVFVIVTVSGIMVSGSVLSALGMYAEGYYFWDPLHAVAAKVLMALLLVHVVVHWRWIVSFATKGRNKGHVELEQDSGNSSSSSSNDDIFAVGDGSGIGGDNGSIGTGDSNSDTGDGSIGIGSGTSGD